MGSVVGVVLKDLWGVRVVIRRKRSVWRLARLSQQLESLSQLLGGIDCVGSGDSACCVKG